MNVRRHPSRAGPSGFRGSGQACAGKCTTSAMLSRAPSAQISRLDERLGRHLVQRGGEISDAPKVRHIAQNDADASTGRVAAIALIADTGSSISTILVRVLCDPFADARTSRPGSRRRVHHEDVYSEPGQVTDEPPVRQRTR